MFCALPLPKANKGSTRGSKYAKEHFQCHKELLSTSRDIINLLLIHIYIQKQSVASARRQLSSPRSNTSVKKGCIYSHELTPLSHQLESMG